MASAVCAQWIVLHGCLFITRRATTLDIDIAFYVPKIRAYYQCFYAYDVGKNGVYLCNITATAQPNSIYCYYGNRVKLYVS